MDTKSNQSEKRDNDSKKSPYLPVIKLENTSFVYLKILTVSLRLLLFILVSFRGKMYA